MTTSDLLWSARDTGPAEVDAALRDLLAQWQIDDGCAVPARALNLVCIVDAQWSGEIANRLRQAGRYHGSRTVVCAVEPGRSSLDARVSVARDEPATGNLAVLRETVVVSLGERHLSHLESIVDPLLIHDLPTAVWSPHGHEEAVDRLLGVAQVALYDSVDDPDMRSALDRAYELSERLYVVDLAWLRSTPWRERIAAAFDPPPSRAELESIRAVTVRHHRESTVVGVLLLGWLSARLGWRPRALTSDDGGLAAPAQGPAGDMVLRLEPTPQHVPGLAGVTVESATGAAMSLDRAAGGLRVRRASAAGRDQTWMATGASRGEGGVLGEGIRQTFLRDPTYRPSLGCAIELSR